VGPGSLDEAALYLLGPILGFVLRLRGITCLHASAVSIGGRAIALVGPASAGKSTTAAALVRMGHRLISEDVVPIVEREGRIEILPGYPRIRLWPRAMRIVLGSEASLPHLTQNWDKRAFDVGDDASVFGHDPVPLAAIYAITKRSWNQRAPLVMDGATSGLSSGAALIKLVGDAYTWYALTREMRAREFALFGRVAATVPIRTLIPHKDPARLPRMCEALIEDLAALQVAPNAAAEPVAAGLSA
jgi:hypothetical protein